MRSANDSGRNRQVNGYHGLIEIRQSEYRRRKIDHIIGASLGESKVEQRARPL
jgi:hypothetical protein